MILDDDRQSFDIDADQNESTGGSSSIDLYSPYASNLGVDYELDFSAYDPQQLGIPLLRFNPQSGSFEPTGTYAFAEFQGVSVLVSMTLDSMDPDGFFNYALVVGTVEEPTDAAPNGGYLTTGRLVGY